NPLIAAMIGGTVSDIGGGKFANGAKSAFFHALFGSEVEAMLKGMAGVQPNPAQPSHAQAAQTNALSVSPAQEISEFWQGVRSFIGKIWALPNTIIGLVYGGIGHVVGMIAGTSPSISFGNNAIQFHNNPLMPSAMALGN